MLLSMLQPYGIAGSTVLDVGGGIGVIDQEMLQSGAERAVLVEASPDSLDMAREEASRAGVADRLELVEGDFVRRAADVSPADIVTLHRVVCCYGDADALVALSAARARTAYGLVLPRDRRLTRLAVRLVNLWFRFRRQSYRGYTHPNERIDQLVAEAGLLPRREATTLIWRVVVYDRGQPAAA
jgi:SAM-dependent methyltransferase